MSEVPQVQKLASELDQKNFELNQKKARLDSIRNWIAITAIIVAFAIAVVRPAMLRSGLDWAESLLCQFYEGCDPIKPPPPPPPPTPRGDLRTPKPSPKPKPKPTKAMPESETLAEEFPTGPASPPGVESGSSDGGKIRRDEPNTVRDPHRTHELTQSQRAGPS